MTDCKHERRLQVPHLPPLTFRGDSISAGRGEITWRLQCADCGAPLNADGTADADFLDEVIAARTAANPEFPRLMQRAAALREAVRASGVGAGPYTPIAFDDPDDSRKAAAFTDDDWKRAADVVDARDATIAALQARVRELEAALAAKS